MVTLYRESRLNPFCLRFPSLALCNKCTPKTTKAISRSFVRPDPKLTSSTLPCADGFYHNGSPLFPGSCDNGDSMKENFYPDSMETDREILPSASAPLRRASTPYTFSNNSFMSCPSEPLGRKVSSCSVSSGSRIKTASSITTHSSWNVPSTSPAMESSRRSSLPLLPRNRKSSRILSPVYKPDDLFDGDISINDFDEDLAMDLASISSENELISDNQMVTNSRLLQTSLATKNKPFVTPCRKTASSQNCGSSNQNFPPKASQQLEVGKFFELSYCSFSDILPNG